MDDSQNLQTMLASSPFNVGQDTTFCGAGACSANEAMDKLALLWSRYASFGVPWLVSGVAPGAVLSKTKGELATLFDENQGVGSVDPILGLRTYSIDSQFARNGALTNTCAAFVVAGMRVMPRGLFVNGAGGAGTRKGLSYLQATDYYHSSLAQMLFQSMSFRTESDYQGCKMELGFGELYPSVYGVKSATLASNGNMSVQYPAPALRCLFVMPNNQVNDIIKIVVTLDNDVEQEVLAVDPPTTTATVIQLNTVIVEGFAVPAIVGLCGNDIKLVGGRLQNVTRG